MSDDNKNENSDAPETGSAADEPQPDQESTQSGPKFTKGPDPFSGVRESASEALDSMEGKTVSMKVYVGSIVGVIILMLLARCGG